MAWKVTMRKADLVKVPSGQIGSEPVFLNVYGAQESIPRNGFRQPL